jgi:hypothetical protein
MAATHGASGIDPSAPAMRRELCGFSAMQGRKALSRQGVPPSATTFIKNNQKKNDSAQMRAMEVTLGAYRQSLFK